MIFILLHVHTKLLQCINRYFHINFIVFHDLTVTTGYAKVNQSKWKRNNVNFGQNDIETEIPFPNHVETPSTFLSAGQ